jgi:hypothetical protein
MDRANTTNSKSNGQGQHRVVGGHPRRSLRLLAVAPAVTSLSLLVCKNVEFQNLDLNLSAYEIIKDVFLFPFLKVLCL